MELLEIIFVREKSIPRSCWNFEALFSLKLATNPIDFYCLLWHTLKARIKDLFIEYKSNLSPIRDLLGLLVQVGEVKLHSFSDFAFMSESAVRLRSIPFRSALELRLSSSLSWGALELILRCAYAWWFG
jgi:hypothetical protein